MRPLIQFMHSEQEHARDTESSVVDDRTEHELYLAPVCTAPASLRLPSLTTRFSSSNPFKLVSPQLCAHTIRLTERTLARTTTRSTTCLRVNLASKGVSYLRVRPFNIFSHSHVLAWTDVTTDWWVTQPSGALAANSGLDVRKRVSN